MLSQRTVVKVTAIVGGPGTFWEGYRYRLGSYRWHWVARLRGELHLLRYPYHAIEFENRLRIKVRKEL